MTQPAYQYFSTPELAIENLQKTGGQFRGIQSYNIDGFIWWTCEGPVKECSLEEALTPTWWNPDWDKFHGIPYQEKEIG